MKKTLFVLLAFVAFTACKEKPDLRSEYKINFKDQVITLDTQGKAVVSCTVFPADLDISELALETDIDTRIQRTNDQQWGSVNIISVTKDASVKGKWLVSFGPTSADDPTKPYIFKSGFNYYLTQESVGVIEVKSDDNYPVKSNKFKLFVDIPQL